jgi:SAM-dependent methyltransferase
MTPDSPWPYDLIARIYDDDMGKNAPPASVAFYLDACKPLERSVLDLGAGTGRIAIPLAEAGHRVTAVDRSEAMLEVLRAKAVTHLRDHAREKLSVHHGDLRDVSLAERFGAVICPFSTLNYLLSDDDRRRALGTVRRHLAPGGLFVMDHFIPDPTFSPDGVEVFDYRRERVDGTWLERRRRVLRDVAPSVHVVVRRYLILSAEGEELAAFGITSRIRPAAVEDLSRELENGGFDVVNIVFDFGELPDGTRPHTATYVCRSRA